MRRGCSKRELKQKNINFDSIIGKEKTGRVCARKVEEETRYKIKKKSLQESVGNEQS